MTKRELIEKLADVPDDAEILVDVETSGGGELHEIEEGGVFFCEGQDDADYTGYPLGIVAISASGPERSWG